MNRQEELIRRCQAGDAAAQEQLLQENTGLIWSVVKRFFGRGTETEDLFQLGCLGFLKAVEGFCPEYGTQFSTYAVPKITGEIRRFLRDDGTLKVSRVLKERAGCVHVAQNSLTVQLGREPTVSELAEKTGLSAEEIAQALIATSAVESIHQPAGDTGFSLECVLSDTSSEEQLLERIALQQAIEKLPQREALVIKLRYFHGLTQQKVSQVLGVSQVQVSRIEKKALELLHRMIA